VTIILFFTILHFHRHSLSLSASGVRKYPVEVPNNAETFPFKCLAVRVIKAYEQAYTIHQLLNTQEMIQRHDK
jgi:hypothetical protein